MKKHFFYTNQLVCLSILLIVIIYSPYSHAQKKEGHYTSDWTSLRKHQTPQWLINSKFGIYCHWGIWTIKYKEGNENLSNDEAINLFTAKHFDANKWAGLFELAGAKFGGVIGWHGSNFLHWDSKFSNYNSYKLNPHIDIVGEVSKAVKAKGMKFLVSYHSIDDDDWINFAKEGVDKYDPDIFWVDASFGGTKEGNFLKTLRNSKYIGQNTKSKPVFHEKYQRDFITYFYNQAIKNNKSVQFVYKSNDIPPGIGMRDLENGLLEQTPYDVWMTDMDMNVPLDWETHGWFYRESTPIRSTNELVDMLVDVVSKNGIFLLNIPPLADGSFPKEVVENLTKLGEWLHVNGEAIYNTSPWFIFGEGPTIIPTDNYNSHHNNHFAKIQFTKEDIRYTINGDYLYLTFLGKPKEGTVVKSLNTNFKLREGDINSIKHLGSNKKMTYKHSENGLEIKFKAEDLNDFANVFKIHLNY
ncbi:alpha-L-fucosidase [Flavivirga eckloniae]|uniref:alpha-L-fucosidase n=1 Tax=Flavivirga eckloniae TaxID=1803846 RepID=A0A2K9PU33_9FLAO|nr:alpha-L-fucosidase [Flavivirga eckloniae]AUP80571.1 hypothetical protein C1H87_18375 [Flavivirga eckloniae]